MLDHFKYMYQGKDVYSFLESVCSKTIEHVDDHYVYLSGLQEKTFKNHKQDELIAYELTWPVEAKLVTAYKGKKRKLWIMDKKVFLFMYSYCDCNRHIEYVQKWVKPLNRDTKKENQ